MKRMRNKAPQLVQERVGKPGVIGYWNNYIHKVAKWEERRANANTAFRYIAECGVASTTFQPLGQENWRRKTCTECWPDGIPDELAYRSISKRVYVFKGGNTQHIRRVGTLNDTYCGQSFYPPDVLLSEGKPFNGPKVCWSCDPSLNPRNAWKDLLKATR